MFLPPVSRMSATLSLVAVVGLAFAGGELLAGAQFGHPNLQAIIPTAGALLVCLIAPLRFIWH